jgi:hypothetical protein
MPLLYHLLVTAWVVWARRRSRLGRRRLLRLGGLARGCGGWAIGGFVGWLFRCRVVRIDRSPRLGRDGWGLLGMRRFLGGPRSWIMLDCIKFTVCFQKHTSIHLTLFLGSPFTAPLDDQGKGKDVGIVSIKRVYRWEGWRYCIIKRSPRCKYSNGNHRLWNQKTNWALTSSLQPEMKVYKELFIVKRKHKTKQRHPRQTLDNGHWDPNRRSHQERGCQEGRGVEVDVALQVAALMSRSNRIFPQKQVHYGLCEFHIALDKYATRPLLRGFLQGRMIYEVSNFCFRIFYYCHPDRLDSVTPYFVWHWE